MVAGLQGAIIAAGRGERLRSGGITLPKPLVELDGEPLLLRQVRSMRAAGVERVLAIVNSETAALLEHRRIELPPELQLIVRDTANSMESLFALGEQLETERFLLTTVDAVMARGELTRFTHAALDTMEADEQKNGALAVVRWRGDHRPLFVQLDESNLISALGSRQSPLVTAGAYLFATRIFEFVPQARSARLGAMREYLGMLIDSGMRFQALELVAAIDIDEPQDLEAARSLVRS